MSHLCDFRYYVDSLCVQNDPYKTVSVPIIAVGCASSLSDPQFCTTAFLCEVAQYIKFGEIGRLECTSVVELDVGLNSPVMPTLQIDRMPDGVEPGSEERLSKEEEDTILQNTCANFADWVAAFLRRVILLFENLPEHPSGGGQTEGTWSYTSICTRC